MGRQVRRVPANWEHPKNNDGGYLPLFDRDYKAAATEWMNNAIRWAAGEHPDQTDKYGIENDVAGRFPFYWEWTGEPPEEEYYRPFWPEKSRTHIQMYEDTSEGTPISPVMETPEELARWLADNDASAFGDMTATYEQWLATIKRGWAPSAVGTIGPSGGNLISGVQAAAEMSVCEGKEDA